MKTLLTIIAALTIFAANAAQTNVTFRILVDVIDAGVTNTTTTVFKLDASTQRDTDRLNGLQWSFASNPGTNTLGTWLRTMISDSADACRKAKLVNDNQSIVSKLTQLLTQDQDKLSVSDINNLISISAKAP